MKQFKIIGSDLSDGYHTFDELYEHRCLLYVNLCLAHKEKCHWQPHYEGWFALYWDSPNGQVSYHCPDKMLPLIEGKIMRNWGSNIWDGHTSQDVINRLTANANGEESK